MRPGLAEAKGRGGDEKVFTSRVLRLSFFGNRREIPKGGYMKKWVFTSALAVAVGAAGLTGCETTGDLKEGFKTMMTDPLSEDHQKRLDELESSYLKGKTTYTEYQRKKKEEMEKYSKEVQERDQLIHEQ